ncbi:hypothetical protein BAUCODRAFT_283976 [Baudoinia panamericana UAMH 10762]|uniref:Uncharacterized protein n=1 Tax=Baudoinia panamericana (strain UAMH 10762) TaxID=717646 RepID=M2MLJ9_BAUPA|nr:uncharacterized protein BAUCODRAFT_283976 [Baudoinia panamericana UAMH 10762]EMC92273.1 hypothetical protein BAUCODRAFT_283976 [Baudoinia panamericana UAMH 10762]
MPIYHGMYSQQQLHDLVSAPQSRRYRYLSAAQIVDLASIVTQSPIQRTQSDRTDGAEACGALRKPMNQFLRDAKVRTSLCKLHDRLSELAVVSLWERLREDIDRELKETWMPMLHDDRLSSLHAQYVCRLLRYPWYTGARDCAACSLGQLGGDTELLLAMGAVTIATLPPKHWKQSRRSFFLEYLLQECVDPLDAENVKQKMFNVGEAFRMMRQASRRPSTTGGNRSNIDYATVNYQHRAKSCEQTAPVRTAPNEQLPHVHYGRQSKAIMWRLQGEYCYYDVNYGPYIMAQ